MPDGGGGGAEERGWLARAGHTPAALLGLALFVTYGYFVAPAAWNENSRFDLTRSLVERARSDIDPFHGNTGDKSYRDGHFYSDKAPGASFLSTLPYAIYFHYLRLTGQELPDVRVIEAPRAGAASGFIPGTETPLAPAVVRAARDRAAVRQSGRDASGPSGEGREAAGKTAGPSPGTAGAPGPDDPDKRILVNTSFRKALYICNLFTNALAGALLGVGFFVLLAGGLGLPPGTSLLSALALGLGSLTFPYATMLYGHVLAGAFLFGAFLVILRARRAGAEPDERALALAGLCTGAAVVAEFPTAVAAAALAIYALSSLRQDRLRFLFFIAGAVTPGALLFLYQGAAFGSPVRPGYALVSGTEFAAGMSKGLMGITYPKLSVLFAILFGRFRGLFYVSPVLLLGFVGLGRLWRSRPDLRREAAVCAVIVAWFVLMNSAYYMWSGGAALGPRHVIPMLPFLCLGIPFAAPRWRWVVPVLAGVSIFNQSIATAVAPEAPIVGDPLFDHAYFHFFHGRVAVLAGTTNIGILIGLPGPLSLLPLVLVWALTLRVLLPALRPAPVAAGPTRGQGADLAGGGGPDGHRLAGAPDGPAVGGGGAVRPEGEPSVATAPDGAAGASARRGVLALVLLVALFHGPSLHNRFAYDDSWTILRNPILRDLGNLAELLGAGPARDNVPDAGRPTLLATEMVDFALWNVRPAGYHLQSLLWHLGVTVLLLAGLLSLTRDPLLSFFAAGLFAVHPLLVEVVAVINYREDLLATFFTLAALGLIHAARRRQGTSAAACRGAAWLASLVALGAKESASVAPALLAVLDLCFTDAPAGEVVRRRWRDWALLLGAAVVAFAWRAWIYGQAGVVSTTAQIPVEHRQRLVVLPLEAWIFVRQVAQLVLPVGLSPEYVEQPGRVAATLAGALCLAGLLAAAGLAWSRRRAHPVVAAGLLWGLVAFLPTAGLVPLSNLRADRYFFLPAVGLLPALAALAIPLAGRWRLLRGPALFEIPRPWLAGGALFLIFGLLTLRQARIWKDDLTLWTTATEKAPGSARSWSALGEALLRSNRTVEAMDAVRRSVAIDPSSGHTRELVGIIKMQQGDHARARAELKQALALGVPDRAELLNNLGYCEQQLGLGDEALPHFSEAARLAPRYDRPLLNKARLLDALGRSGEAEQTLRDLLHAIPESIDGWKQLGGLLEHIGRADDAVRAYGRARRLAPRDAEIKRALDRLARGGDSLEPPPAPTVP